MMTTGHEPASEPLLALEDVTVSYGGVVALDEVSMAVRPGGIVGLIGPNGAGKTTLVDALTGFTPYLGSIRLRGQPIDGFPPHTRASLGISRTFQAGDLFDDLTVQENIAVRERRTRTFSATMAALVLGRQEPLQAPTEALVDALDLRRHLPALAGELTGGLRKLVTVAQALAGRPDLVLLDEPAAGLDSVESERFGERLRGLAGGGVTILLVDHDMDLVAGVCDEVVVLDFGRVIATGAPRDVLNDPAVVEAYLGRISAAGYGVS